VGGCIGNGDKSRNWRTLGTKYKDSKIVFAVTSIALRLEPLGGYVHSQGEQAPLRPDIWGYGARAVFLFLNDILTI